MLFWWSYVSSTAGAKIGVAKKPYGQHLMCKPKKSIGRDLCAGWMEDWSGQHRCFLLVCDSSLYGSRKWELCVIFLSGTAQQQQQEAILHGQPLLMLDSAFKIQITGMWLAWKEISQRLHTSCHPWWNVWAQKTKTAWVERLRKINSWVFKQSRDECDQLVWCSQKNTDVIVGCFSSVFLAVGDMITLLYKWLIQSNIHYSIQVHSQKYESWVEEGQRRVIKKEREVEQIIPQEQNKRAWVA